MNTTASDLRFGAVFTFRHVARISLSPQPTERKRIVEQNQDTNPASDSTDEEKKQAKEAAQKVHEKEEEILRMCRASRVLRRFKDDVVLLLALLRDFTTGRYRNVPYRVILAITIALAYVLSVIDGVPDTIPIAGLMDDAAVIALLMVWADDEIQRYKKWRDMPMRE